MASSFDVHGRNGEECDLGLNSGQCSSAKLGSEQLFTIMFSIDRHERCRCDRDEFIVLPFLFHTIRIVTSQKQVAQSMFFYTLPIIRCLSASQQSPFLLHLSSRNPSCFTPVLANFLPSRLLHILLYPLRRTLLLLLTRFHRLPPRPLHARPVHQNPTNLQRAHDRKTEVHGCQSL